MSGQVPLSLPQGWAVLACRVLEPELSLLLAAGSRVEYLDQGLHRTPDLLRDTVAAKLKEMEEAPGLDTVILAYGYCGGGLKEITAQRVRLVVPAVHDCIPLLLGRFPQRDTGQPAAFYLSAGWIDHGQTPFTEFQRTKEKYGEEDALWVGREMLKGYDRVTLVTSSLTEDPRYPEHARQSAALFGLAYDEAPAGFGWLKALLAGGEGLGCLIVPPDTPLELSMFPSQGVQAPAARE